MKVHDGRTSVTELISPLFLVGRRGTRDSKECQEFLLDRQTPTILGVCFSLQSRGARMNEGALFRFKISSSLKGRADS
jgi:hypothetical protein